MASRALFRDGDLRRWAKIAREEGVNLIASADGSGAVIIRLTATPLPVNDASGDLDARLDAFGAR